MRIVAKPIDAIVVFKGEHHPLPYKFRYSGTDGETVEVKVGKVILVSEQRLAGIKSLVYDCQSEIEDSLKRYQLKYFVAECKWELYKI